MDLKSILNFFYYKFGIFLKIYNNTISDYFGHSQFCQGSLPPISQDPPMSTNQNFA